MRKLRMGLIGGGPGSSIGRIHRLAAQLDGGVELVCGAFSSDARKSAQTGADLCLDPARSYASFQQMMAGERLLAAARRMDFVTIATPNHLHFEPARLALECGFHVIVDKPLCFACDQARDLCALVERSGRVFAVTYTYSGYPLVKEMRARIAAGAIGAVRKVTVAYRQGWLATAVEAAGQKQAAWRTDPERAGAGGALGDIGTHAAHLAEYVTGLRITAINAMLNTFVPGRRLDDDTAMLLRFEQGASGMLCATQIAAGEENDLSIRIDGETGGFEWRQEEPNSLILRHLDRPREVLRAGWEYAAASGAARTPAGHPEGYIEAFANLYRAFARAVRDCEAGRTIVPSDYDFPGVEDGARGMAFIDAVVRSAHAAEKWTEFT